MKIPGILLLAGVFAACGASKSSDPKKDSPAILQPETSAIPQQVAVVKPVLPAEKPSEWAIQHTYKGRVNAPMSRIGSNPGPIAPMFIRDEAEMAAFVSMIPRNKITKKSPAPASDDPLLQPIEIDFAKEMLIVAFRVDTMYVYPELGNVRTEGAKLLVDLKHPPLGDMEFAAAQFGIGTYQAIVVKHFAGTIDVVRH